MPNVPNVVRSSMRTQISSKADALKIAFCSHKAAIFAAKRWHYSGTIPVGKQVRFGVWEFDTFVGVVCFGTGANPSLGKRFGIERREVAELTRVALNNHATPVSRIVRICLSMLRATNPGLMIIVSFADPKQGHVGGIYQAGGWVYLGESNPETSYLINGHEYHRRTLTASNFGGLAPSKDLIKIAKKIRNPGKHRYAIALNKKDRKMLAEMQLPYPKRTKPSSEASGFQPEEGGAIPTRALQSSDRE